MSGDVGGQHRKPGGHGLQHHLGTTFRMAGEGKEPRRAREPFVPQFGRVGGAVPRDPGRQGERFLHGAEEVQFTPALEKSFSPGQQLPQFAPRQPGHGEPAWHAVRTPLHLEPVPLHTEGNGTHFGHIAEACCQPLRHPGRVGRQDTRVPAQHPPQGTRHARQGEQFVIAPQHRHQGGTPGRQGQGVLKPVDVQHVGGAHPIGPPKAPQKPHARRRPGKGVGTQQMSDASPVKQPLQP